MADERTLSQDDTTDDEYEQFRERYRRERETFADPEYERAKDYLAHAVSSGQIVLKWAFFLNGGALVALPAMQQIDVAFEKWMAIPFIAGLLLAAAAAISAYGNLMFLSRTHQNRGLYRSYEAVVLNAIVLNSEDVERRTEVKAATRRDLDECRKKAEYCGKLSLVAGIGSYIAFIVGCFILL